MLNAICNIRFNRHRKGRVQAGGVNSGIIATKPIKSLKFFVLCPLCVSNVCGNHISFRRIWEKQGAPNRSLPSFPQSQPRGNQQRDFPNAHTSSPTTRGLPTGRHRTIDRNARTYPPADSAGRPRVFCRATLRAIGGHVAWTCDLEL